LLSNEGLCCDIEQPNQSYTLRCLARRSFKVSPPPFRLLEQFFTLFRYFFCFELIDHGVAIYGESLQLFPAQLVKPLPSFGRNILIAAGAIGVSPGIHSALYLEVPRSCSTLFDASQSIIIYFRDIC